ncbi:MAG TPA: hypothetical protein VM802_23355 [Chitinophaga sp.]|uniref:hypothetical protein n=1 Tax=Chitinophaga sp. TaxID=1869181 RepID=UPI002BB232BE|nr:hypothetical protein [Chitinophaga sp.]HVI47826.1 hypothetical protein [Chitinophaga sp.]
MKGTQVLFTRLLTDDSAQPLRHRPGRSSALLIKRDERLVYRHYYYLRICKKRYDEIMKILSEEFDLSEYTIIERLQLERNFKLLKQIMTQQPGSAELKKLYPWMVWK